ncbi:alpha-L-fucosidase [Paenibacillus sp. UNCCL117]|nr:alpha-L-fucosidase [Paenibacillus sp. cl123]SFW38070.1 alpha-L-fucosidase [Paenibacillus sp. UNCCL117]
MQAGRAVPIVRAGDKRLLPGWSKAKHGSGEESMGQEDTKSLPAYWSWFKESRYGAFIHWGPYAQYARGEQILFREHMDHREYAEAACRWNPQHWDPELWAYTIRKAGMKYACFTTRHHDGYCMWDSQYTNYSSAKQAPGRDFVADFVRAFRAEGLRVGLYYSWLDWRIPAYFDGPEKDPEGWREMRDYCHHQVLELLSGYGRIDHFFFDGAWPRTHRELRSLELVQQMRELQPHILINNRLGVAEELQGAHADGGGGAGERDDLGDFGTPEHRIAEDPNRLWESCQVTTSRLWGYAAGERWRSAEQWLDMLCECAETGSSGGGNLLLNVGPQPDGQLPAEFVERALEVGSWLDVHGEAIYGTDGGSLTEFVTRGRQTRKGCSLYLIIRFWDGRPEMLLRDLPTEVAGVTLLTTGQTLPYRQNGDILTIFGLPKERPTRLFPVIRVEFTEPPQTTVWGRERLWQGDPSRIADWARTRGTSVYADGEPGKGSQR